MILGLLLERGVHLVEFALLARLLLVLLHALLELGTRLVVGILQSLHLMRERVDFVFILHDPLLELVALESQFVMAILASATLMFVSQIDLICEEIDSTCRHFQDWKRNLKKGANL